MGCASSVPKRPQTDTSTSSTNNNNSSAQSRQQVAAAATTTATTATTTNTPPAAAVPVAVKPLQVAPEVTAAAPITEAKQTTMATTATTTTTATATATATSSNTSTSIIVFGASGDLSSKKTFPALFGLFLDDYLPANVRIFGYARSKLDQAKFHDIVSKYIKAKTDEAKEKLKKFLEVCQYVSGSYDVEQDYRNLDGEVAKTETAAVVNRIFYLALPPSVFIPVATLIRKAVYSAKGFNRLIVEKPFGRDLASSAELADALAAHWKEEEIYRIDHYLGKEMVKSIMILRFANMFLNATWNRTFISNVQITFKEPFGTEGRGGYFDEFGIIRDVMQNHMLQILSLIAMEKPVSMDSEAVRDEKVRVLRCIQPLSLEDMVIGQYVKSEDGTKPAYLDDSTVPTGSNTPTFAAAVFHIKNERWDGVPFIMKCGKALNERKTEIRIQWRDVAANIFNDESARNELVIRVQPDEAVYLKFNNKKPGFFTDPIITELDLTYKERYSDHHIPEAYEALILDVLNGDHANFVRDDELEVAWKIFTPVLHKIENEKVQPEPYPYGSRGPASSIAFVEKNGYVRHKQEYVWKKANESRL